MRGEFLFAMGAWLAGALVLLFIGSTLLRTAVALANRTIGRVKSEEPIGWDWDADEDDEDPSPTQTALPEPGTRMGMQIVFLAALAHLPVILALDFVLDEVLRVRRGVESGPGFVLTVAVGFLVLAGLTAWRLPTTFRRAALVAAFFYIILAAIWVVLYGLFSAVFR